MITKYLQNKIWKFQQTLDSAKFNYWKNISISLEVVENCVRKFGIEKNAIAAGYAKLLIMELWTIREMLKGLNKSTSGLDAIIPNLKKFRDSYAHIKERVEGSEKPFNQPKVALKRETRSIANGLLISIDEGKTWQIKEGSSLFNFDGKGGMLSIFGIVDNFLICNSSDELLELEINDSLLEKINNAISDVCV